MKKWHLWLAASIGLVVIVGMMIREFDVEVLSRIDLSPRFFLGVVMGVLLFAVQNLMLTLRFRHLCQRKLSVAEAFRITLSQLPPQILTISCSLYCGATAGG